MFKWLLKLACFMLFTHIANATIVPTKITSFPIPYNFNSDFKMDPKEHVAYLAMITKDGNGSNVVHLWSEEETNGAIKTSELIKQVTSINQYPKKLRLAIHYESMSSIQYIGYIDDNSHTLTLMKRYFNGGLFWSVDIIKTSIVGTIDTMDMATTKDGRLLIATVETGSRKVHLFEYNSGQPTPLTDITGTNSSLVAAANNNPDEFKLTLVGSNEIPYVVFSSPGSYYYGAIAAAYIVDWNQNNNIKTWSSISIANYSNQGLFPRGEPLTNHIDVIAAPDSDKALVAFQLSSSDITGGAYLMGIAEFSAANGWGNLNYSHLHRSADLVMRYPTLATDGSSVYLVSHVFNGSYLDYQMSTYNDMSNYISLASLTDGTDETINNHPNLVMNPNDYTNSDCKGFLFVQDDINETAIYGLSDR